MNEKVTKEVASGQTSVIALLNNYVLSNPITVITAAGSLIGGLLILFYLISIQYFPSNMDVSTVGFLLAGSAITGTFMTFLFALYLVLPGIFYRHVLNDQAPTGLVQAPADQVQADQVQAPTKQLNMLTGRAIFWFLDVPSFIVHILFITFLFGWNGIQREVVIAAIIICLLSFGGSWYRKSPDFWRPSKMAINSVVTFKASVLSSFFASGFIALLPWLIIWALVSQYAQAISDINFLWAAFLVMSIIAIGANHLIAGAKEWWLLPIIASFLLFLLLAITEQFSLIPKAVVRTLAFGNMPNVTLMLDEQGCQIASQYVLAPQDFVASIKPVLPASKETKNNSDKKDESSIVCRLALVNLKWRIGNEYFIDASHAQLYSLSNNNPTGNGIKTKKKELQRQIKPQVPVNKDVVSVKLPPLSTSGFTMSSAHVLSWSMAEQQKLATQ